MIRLFVRFYLGVTIAIFVSLLLGGLLLDQQYQKTLAQDYMMYTKALHDHMEKELSGLSVEKWPEKIKASQERYAFYIDIVELNSLPMAIAQQLESSGESIVVESDLIQDKATVYYLIDQSQQVIRYIAKNITYQEYNWIVLGYFLLLMLALAGAVFILAKPIARHISRLAKVSEQFGQGDLDARADEKAPYPLDHLAKTMNQMSNQIKQLIKEQEIMTGAVSHEIRTPMANLRFALDMTRNIDDLKALRNHIEEMDQDIDTMESLVDELLTYARLNQSVDTSLPQKLSIAEEIDNAIKQVNQFRTDIDIEVNVDPDIQYPLYKSDFNRAMINLLRNAQKYADYEIKVSVIKTNSKLTIHIDDDGPGIPSGLREDIFIPFKRLDQSRSKESGGYGLGLAIVERIMQKHQGKVTVSDSPNGGARFSLVF